VEREALARADADVVVMAAAVSDYRPTEQLDTKRPKDGRAWQVDLEPTADVLQALGERRQNGQVLVGFAADTGESGLARAGEKLTRKHLDLIVYNDVGSDGIGFDSEDNEVVIVSPAGRRPVARAPKRAIAARVLDEIEKVLAERDGQP
jgi:phosphopantothenoylcysteine decarboxylase/phosphopantothenate--cysteine ligase